MKQKLLTEIRSIPNILSCLRLALIPVIVWLYCGAANYTLAAVVLIISGITDIADGFIARKFKMVTDLGKVLDPMSDKLTQGAIFLCLATRYSPALYLFILLAIKEAAMLLIGAYAYRVTGAVNSARWHGKLSSMLLEATMIIFMIFTSIPFNLMLALIIICAAATLLSLILYLRMYFILLRTHKGGCES